MRTIARFTQAVVFAIAVAPSVAFAQASIAGVVKDSSGAVLPGATVEASSPDLRQIRRLVAQSEELEQAVGPIELIFGHNDLLAANIIDDGKKLWLVDWEYAGWGAPGADLAQFIDRAVSPDLGVYRSVLTSAYPHLDEPTIQRVAGCGTLLRLVDSMYWATTWMGPGEYRYSAKVAQTLRNYEPRLNEELRAMKWS